MDVIVRKNQYIVRTAIVHWVWTLDVARTPLVTTDTTIIYQVRILDASQTSLLWPLLVQLLVFTKFRH